jgi:hypothetical protein
VFVCGAVELGHQWISVCLLLQLLWGQGCSNCCKNFLALLITCVFFVGIGVPSFFSSHVLPLGVVCFFCLGCFLVCVGMGSAWGVCWMGWDRMGKHVGCFLFFVWVWAP